MVWTFKDKMQVSPEKVDPDADDFQEDKSHYHFRIRLRVCHPSADPDWITEAIGTEPNRAWKAGERRQTPAGNPLLGINRDTYWTVTVLAGRYPDRDLNTGVRRVLDRLVRCRDFFHSLRLEGGSAELFIAWCFERQSGDVLTHDVLGKAADLKINLSFDVYPPTEPQNEYEVSDDVLPL